MSNITITPEDREAYRYAIAESHRSGTLDAAYEVIARHRLSGHQQGVAEERERCAQIADCWFTDDCLNPIVEAIRTPNKGEAA